MICRGSLQAIFQSFQALPRNPGDKVNHYAYAFRCEPRNGETFFKFSKFPEIISSLSTSTFRKLGFDERIEHATDAVLVALQLKIASRTEVPSGDRPALLKAGLYVALAVPQAMKLELFRVYLSSGCRSISEFARALDKGETLVRRLLDLRHPSQPKEIEEALGLMGKRLIHSWDLEDRTARLGPKRRRQAASRATDRSASL